MKVIYEPLEDEKGFNHLKRVGMLTEKSDILQVDELTFIPLEKKVESILKGNPNFIAEDPEMDYDEPESDNWDNVDENEDELQVFPIDEYSDKDDVIEVQRNAQKDIKAIKDELSKANSEISVVDETKDSSKQVKETKENVIEK